MSVSRARPSFLFLLRQGCFRHLLSCSCTGVLLLLAIPVAAGAASPNFETISVAKDVYAVIAKPGVLGGWGIANGAFIVNEKDVVVVDTQMRPSWAAEVLSEIRKVTDKPVRYVINTHWHRDHTQGNQVYVDAFGPGVVIIQHELAREDQIKNQAGELNVRTPEDIAKLEKLIATNKDEKGGDLDPANRTRIVDLLAMQRSYLAEVPNIRATPGTLTFSDKLDLHEGSHEISVRYFGCGHTRGDIVVFLPVEKVVITGDMVQAGIPDMRHAYPLKWLGTLQALRALDWNINIPGHGSVQNDRKVVDRFIAYLSDLITGVKAAAAKNMTPDQAVEFVDLKKYIPPQDQAFYGSASWTTNERNAAAVRRTYDEISGKVEE